MKILVSRTTSGWRRRSSAGLEQEGYAVDVALDGTDGRWMATEQAYDAIVLDVMLPGINGYRLCAGLREAGNWTPILMLTAKRGEYDEAEALDTGADDFLSKPFSFVVLLARLRALRAPGPRANGPRSSRSATSASTRPRTSACAAAREIALSPARVRGARVPRCAGRATAVSKREMLEHVWDFAFEGDDNIVEVYVAPAAPQDRRALRTDDDPDRARRRVPDRVDA